MAINEVAVLEVFWVAFWRCFGRGWSGLWRCSFGSIIFTRTPLGSGEVWEITHFLTFYTEKISESGTKQDPLVIYIHKESEIPR